MKKIVFSIFMLLVFFSACAFQNAIVNEQGHNSSSVESSFSNTMASSSYQECSEDETKTFAKSDEAFVFSNLFASYNAQMQFDSTNDWKNSNKVWALFNHTEELKQILGSEFYNDEILRVPQKEADDILYKYYGVKNYDPYMGEIPFINGEFHLSLVKENSPWVIDYIEIEKIEGNLITYKYCFHFGIYDELPGPYQTSYMVLETLKSNNQTFFRLVSKYGLSEEFSSIN